MFPNPINSCSFQFHFWHINFIQLLGVANDTQRHLDLLFGQIKTTLFKMPIWILWKQFPFLFQTSIDFRTFRHFFPKGTGMKAFLSFSLIQLVGLRYRHNFWQEWSEWFNTLKVIFLWGFPEYEWAPLTFHERWVER